MLAFFTNSDFLHLSSSEQAASTFSVAFRQASFSCGLSVKINMIIDCLAYCRPTWCNWILA